MNRGNTGANPWLLERVIHTLIRKKVKTVSLHAIVTDLKSVEADAEKRVAKAETGAESRISAAVKRAEQEFDKLKADLETSREKKLQQAERLVKKEVAKIAAEGRAESKRMAGVAKAKKKEIEGALTTLLFP